MVAPVLAVIPYSLYKWDGITAARFIGFKNFILILSDKVFYTSLLNTLIIIVVSQIVMLPLSFGIAVLLRRNFRGNSFYKTAIFLPIIVAPIIIALTWGFILEPGTGLINTILNEIGLSFLAFGWLGSKHLSIFTISFVWVWNILGLDMIIFLAGMRSISKDIFEAAEIDGANNFNRTFSITLPLVKEQILMCLILNTTGSVKIFELVYFLTTGGPGHYTEVLSTYMFKMGFGSYNYGYGMTISFFVFLIGLILSITFIKILRREES